MPGNAVWGRRTPSIQVNLPPSFTETDPARSKGVDAELRAPHKRTLEASQWSLVSGLSEPLQGLEEAQPHHRSSRSLLTAKGEHFEESRSFRSPISDSENKHHNNHDSLHPFAIHQISSQIHTYTHTRWTRSLSTLKPLKATRIKAQQPHFQQKSSSV